MRALDGPILEMPCAGADDLEACVRPQDCSVHEVFERVHESLGRPLAGTTLAEAAIGRPADHAYPTAVRRQRACSSARQNAARRNDDRMTDEL